MKEEEKKNQIGLLNEGSLHSQLKEYYIRPGDLSEQGIDGYFIDIVRDNLLIEIQTAHFSAIKIKLTNLLRKHKVRLIYPVRRKKSIVFIDPLTSVEIRRRKSPKKGKPIDLFNELIRIPTLINKRGFQIEILFIHEEEVRCNDGKGSWRRKGISIIERRLVKVYESKIFKTKKDFLALLPAALPSPFTNKILSSELKCNIKTATKMTYCLKKMGLIHESGKTGRSIAYTIAGK
ncbi:MAG: hypothetical protein JXJ04_27205 [Spirochaetales bacterium]|nr:hypothetical protein [Spirochaetales bacterium]